MGKGDISTNKGDISSNTDDISTNKGDISTNKGDISTNKDDISTNKDDISTNKGDISTNKDAISTNSDDIQSLVDAPVVGLCAYQDRKDGTGIISYKRLVSHSVSSDGSTINLSTGKYTVVTPGLYTITWSAEAHGYTHIYLYLDNVKQEDSLYLSN